MQALRHLAVLTGAALALGAWSSPQLVPGSPDAAPTLRATASGTVVLAADASGPRTLGAVAAADATFGALAVLTSTNFTLGPRFAPYATKSLTALGTHASSTGGRAGLAFGTAGSKLTNIRWLGPSDRPGAAEALSANAAGDVAATFGACANSACQHQILYLVRRRAGSSPDGSRRLDDTAITISTTAVNARGDLLVAWQGNGGVYAQILTKGGTLYAKEHVANVGEPVRSLSAVLGPDRGALVAWEAQDVGEGQPESDAIVSVAVKQAGASHTFHSAQTLETIPPLGTGHYVAAPGVRAGLTADGRLTVAWTGYTDPRFVVRAADLPSGSFRFGTPATLTGATTDTILGDLAVGPSGNATTVAVLAGLRGNDPVNPKGATLQACTRAATATAFAPCAAVTDGTTVPQDVSAAYAPTPTPRAILAWRSVGPQEAIATAHE